MNKMFDDYLAFYKDQFLKDLEKLIAIKSVNAPSEGNMPFGKGVYDALQCAMDIAKGYGFKTKNFNNYIGTVDFNSGQTELGILAHLDVVPEGKGWTKDPYKMVFLDGKVYGRGTSDDKGPALAALYAMKMLKDLNIIINKNVKLILGTAEETGSADIDYYFKVEKPPKFVFSPDAEYPVINAEKGRISCTVSYDFKGDFETPYIKFALSGDTLNIVPGEATAELVGIRGHDIKTLVSDFASKCGVKVQLKPTKTGVIIKVTGTGAHASTPEKGNNGATALIGLLGALPLKNNKQLKGLYGLFPHDDFYGQKAGIAQKDETGNLTANLGIFNMDEKSLYAKFDIRTPVSANQNDIESILTQKTNEIGLNLNNFIKVAPHFVPPDCEFIKVLNNAYEKYSGRKGGCVAVGGGTYVHHMEEYGSTGVAFGASLPETDTRMHGADEFAVVDELLMSIKIFAECIINICGK